MQRWYRSWKGLGVRLLAMGCVSMGLLPALLPKSAVAADTIYLTVGPLKLSLPVADLETFAETGEITPEFRFYAQFLKPQRLEQLRGLLQRRFPIAPLAIAQYTYTPLGEANLKQLGKVVQTEAGADGFHAIRAALILGARDPKGLTPLTILRYFPTRGIRISADDLLKLQNELVVYFNYRDAALSAIAQEMQTEMAAQPAVDFSQRPDLTQPGPYTVETRTLDFTNRRSRQSVAGEQLTQPFEVDLYLPVGLTQPAPVIVYSHGLGAARQRTAWLANHLASYGFVVVMPEHVGSSLERRENVLRGLLRSDINPVAYVDRSYDIKATLDGLEALAQTEADLKGRLDLQRVGVMGNSLGGHTALSVSGAEINHERLRQVCANQQVTLNLSVTLQCLANRLPPLNYNLREPRIKAVVAIHPPSSIVAGPEEIGAITIPTLIMAGSADILAPTTPEQIYPFTWLKTAEKYLLMMVPSGHIFQDPQDNIPEALGILLGGPEPQRKRRMVQAFSVAFWQVYLNQRPEYQDYLTGAYANYLSGEQLRANLIRSLTTSQIEQEFGGPPPTPVVPSLAALPQPDQVRGVLRRVQQTGTLSVAIAPNSPPLGITQSGQLSGYCVDLMQQFTTELGQQLQRPIRLELLPITNSNERFERVKQGTVVLECGPNTVRTPRSDVAFSTPFFITGTHFLVRPEPASSLNPLLLPESTTLGVLRQSDTEDFVNQRYPAVKKRRFQGPNGLTAGVDAVLQGQLDAFAADGILLLNEIARQGIPRDRYALIPTRPLTCDPYGLILPTGDPQWESVVNQFIGSRSARQVWDKWFTQTYPYQFLTLDFCADR